jgi:hypothetical protein
MPGRIPNNRTRKDTTTVTTEGTEKDSATTPGAPAPADGHEAVVDPTHGPDVAVPCGPLDELSDSMTFGTFFNPERDLGSFLDPGIVTEDLIAAAAKTSEMEDRLRDWWLKRSEDEVSLTVPKAAEYGSGSLTDMGHTLAKMQGRVVNEGEAQELAIWFYVVSKVGRWTDAVMRGDRPSEDTIFDLGIYTRMALRVRDAGSWPGV